MRSVSRMWLTLGLVGWMASGVAADSVEKNVNFRQSLCRQMEYHLQRLESEPMDERSLRALGMLLSQQVNAFRNPAINVDSRASPDLWQQMDAFKEQRMSLLDQVQVLGASGRRDTLGVARLRSGCNSCHIRFARSADLNPMEPPAAE